MRGCLAFLLILFYLTDMSAQSKVNYEESQIPDFELSDPLVSLNGTAIKNRKQWEDLRRSEILSFFESEVYGKIPATLDNISFKLIEEKKPALNGKAYRKQIEIKLQKNGQELSFTVLIYLPQDQEKVPVFLGLNFHGNHTVMADNNILISGAWSLNNQSLGIENNTLDSKSRGGRAHRWSIDKILAAGMGLATIYYGEIDPDKNDLTDGLQALYYKQNQKQPASDEWGSIGAWAYGLSRAMDYLQTDEDVDPSRVIVFGHSRLGKAALWAAATDPRFAAVISNNSGCGGAALSKRRFGETIAAINTNFPYWFCENYKQFNNAEDLLSFDQHTLLSLIAPRPLYVASASEDQWADPKGEFLSAFYASPVYKLYGLEGITQKTSPNLNEPIQNVVAYHIRSGKHEVTDFDWEQYIRWAKKVLPN